MVNRTAPFLFAVTCLAALAAWGATPSVPIKIRWLDASGAAIDPPSGGIGFWRPGDPDDEVGKDDGAFRIEISGVPRGARVRVRLASLAPDGAGTRDTLEVANVKATASDRASTPFLVLVADADDRNAPRLAGKALRAALGDVIEARVAVEDAPESVFCTTAGGPLRERRRLKIRATILRASRGGIPIVGGDENGARAVMTYELRVLGEVLAQCAIAPVDAGFDVVDPPGPCLLAVGERFGMPSSGGEIRVQVDGRRLGPWRVPPGLTPLETARELGRRLVETGFLAEASENARLANAAHGTADVLVRRHDGTLARIEPWAKRPLTTDRSQSLSIGEVRLDDGLTACRDDDARVGTLEERTLVKALAGGGSEALELFVAGRFAGASKQGESFVRSSGSSLKDVVILDLPALARARQSFTLSHEVAHVLLDDLGHPDDRGDARPFLLMNSFASSAVNGPKRLTAADCEAMRTRSANLLR
ncbi:MAG: hypothetical protein PHU25_13295 [Deltaproteobacteria bacterium]|nr:hypothetical protein [Deltaproteobacteria bacterium]